MCRAAWRERERERERERARESESGERKEDIASVCVSMSCSLTGVRVPR